MLNKLRDQIAAYLAHSDMCILSTAGAPGAWAMPVRYRSCGLEVECLMPRWTDVTHYVEQDPRVLLVIPGYPPSTPLAGGSEGGLRWLQVQGIARPVAAPDWAGLLPGRASTTPPDALYLVVRVTPQRMDLFDEGRGWGARETLEL